MKLSFSVVPTKRGNRTAGTPSTEPRKGKTSTEPRVRKRLNETSTDSAAVAAAEQRIRDPKSRMREGSVGARGGNVSPAERLGSAYCAIRRNSFGKFRNEFPRDRLIGSLSTRQEQAKTARVGDFPGRAPQEWARGGGCPIQFQPHSRRRKARACCPAGSRTTTKCPTPRPAAALGVRVSPTPTTSRGANDAKQAKLS